MYVSLYKNFVNFFTLWVLSQALRLLFRVTGRLFLSRFFLFYLYKKWYVEIGITETNRMVLTGMAKLFYALVGYYTNENSEYDAFNFESMHVCVSDPSSGGIVCISEIGLFRY